MGTEAVKLQQWQNMYQKVVYTSDVLYFKFSKAVQQLSEFSKEKERIFCIDFFFPLYFFQYFIHILKNALYTVEFNE